MSHPNLRIKTFGLISRFSQYWAAVSATSNFRKIQFSVEWLCIYDFQRRISHFLDRLRSEWWLNSNRWPQTTTTIGDEEPVPGVGQVYWRHLTAFNSNIMVCAFDITSMCQKWRKCWSRKAKWRKTKKTKRQTEYLATWFTIKFSFLFVVVERDIQWYFCYMYIVTGLLSSFLILTCCREPNAMGS